MLMHDYVDEAMHGDVATSGDHIGLMYPPNPMMLQYYSSHVDVSSNDHMGLLRRAFSYLAKHIRTSLNGRPYQPEHALYYPKECVCISRRETSHVNWDEVFTIGQSAFSSMQLHGSSNDSMIDSEARNITTLLYPHDGEIDTFRGKYVLVCCVNVPASYRLRGMQSLFNLCNELASMQRDDVEIIMVARIHFLCDAPQLFHHVFRGLPDSCHIVSYDDWERREHIYKKLSFGEEESQCFVYNMDGMFLKSFCADGYDNPYGAEAFPFTEEMVEKVHGERVALRQACSLEELLRPSYEDYPKKDVFVYEFNQTHGPMWPISQVIKNKHVGLLVCCNGNLIPLLHELHKQCRERNEEFEIVVLYLPLISSMDPEVFKENIDMWLQQEQVRGWWCLPFNNSVSLRFWGLTKDYDIGMCRFQEKFEDKLIIVGTDGKVLDMYGAEVINTHGIDGTYPFTRAAVAEKMSRNLRSGERLLESLWEAQLFRGDNRGDVIHGSSLLNKKVIIYMGVALEHVANGITYDFQRLVSQYVEMKKRDVGDEFEVVFVEFPISDCYGADDGNGAVDGVVFSEMPWYIHCPLNGNYTTLSKELLELVAPAQTLVGFGEDGRICSVKLLEKLHKTDGLCLGDTLLEDLHPFHRFDEFCDI